MTTEVDEILAHLKPLVGLKLTIARRAADLRGFHFGQIRSVESGTIGDFALHIQCPWRLESAQGIVTGSSDLWESANIEKEIDWDSWNYDKEDNLQDKLIGKLLNGYDPQTNSIVNESEQLVVQHVFADKYGGAEITLSGEYRLVLFPAGAQGEDWRIFRPAVDEPHFVIVGGRIEQGN